MVNDMNNKKSLANVFVFIFFIITAGIIFIAHRSVPFMMDDLWYSTILYDQNRPIAGIKDIFDAQVWHYFNWGGRSMTHTLLQIILLCGDSFANILNTVVTFVLSYVILVASKDIAGIKKISATSGVLCITLIAGALHGLNANWEMSMYWQSGSANYLYITVFLLLFAWCYTRELAQEAPAPLKGISFWIVPLAVLAGWSNENMGPTVWLIAVFTMIVLMKKKRSIKIWMILGSLFSFVGSAACILAPGNFVRSAEAQDEKGIIWKLFLRCYSECRGALDFLFPIVIVTVVLAAIYFGAMKKKIDLKTIVFMLAAVIACGAMILSPHFPDRATFGSMVFLLTAAVSIVIRIIKENAEMKIWMIVSGGIIWLHGMFFLLEHVAQMQGWIA